MQYRYTEDFKESIIKKMMPPNPVSVSQLRKETGVSDVTLYKWRKDYHTEDVVRQQAEPNRIL
ncbi:MAG: transposase [Gammaproteobacteria bacterium]|nr:transposase [Gammaproteobacteria bacterium]